MRLRKEEVCDEAEQLRLQAESCRVSEFDDTNAKTAEKPNLNGNNHHIVKGENHRVYGENRHVNGENRHPNGGNNNLSNAVNGTEDVPPSSSTSSSSCVVVAVVNGEPRSSSASILTSSDAANVNGGLDGAINKSVNGKNSVKNGSGGKGINRNRLRQSVGIKVSKPENKNAECGGRGGGGGGGGGSVRRRSMPSNLLKTIYRHFVNWGLCPPPEVQPGTDPRRYSFRCRYLIGTKTSAIFYVTMRGMILEL